MIQYQPLSNIRSLRNKLNYVIDIVEDLDIIFFTETHLDNSISDADISLPSFEVPIRRDRQNTANNKQVLVLLTGNLC
jgi:hypothetical protein